MSRLDFQSGVSFQSAADCQSLLSVLATVHPPVPFTVTLLKHSVGDARRDMPDVGALLFVVGN